MTTERRTDADSTALPMGPVLSNTDTPARQSCEFANFAQPTVAQSNYHLINVDPKEIHGGRLRASSATGSLDSSRPYRKLSPGLAARMKLLDITNRKSRVLSNPALGTDKIGRIPESQIRNLEHLHQNQPLEIQRRGRAWSHNDRPSTADRVSIHIISDSNSPTTQEADEGQSDSSSIVNTEADMVEPSGDELDALGEDTKKYRLPDPGKVLQSSRAIVETINPTQPTEDASMTPLSTEALNAVTLDDTNSLPELGAPIRPGSSESIQSYLHSISLSRTSSVYSISRASFSNQLLQLTSLQLPQASALCDSVLEIPTAPAASRVLAGAAEQIRKWIAKASDVLRGLQADDDVEWAAAGGREGLTEMDNAISQFEGLIEVYISAIEQLQLRKDISSVPARELKLVVEQMEKTLSEWQRVRLLLNGIKEQVELAMEFEELWSVVLGDIGAELQALSCLIFEMEEKRHMPPPADGPNDGVFGLDLIELQTVVEENPNNDGREAYNHRLILSPAFSPSSPMPSPRPSTAQDDTNLLALFARMQPLRASLDFLPMRLATFHGRAEHKFPAACRELESKRQALEMKWRRLEADAETLRCELSEDRWVVVFRNAGRQAQKMCESVGRSLSKLFEAVDSGTYQNSPASLAKKIESYEAKKMHYAPAIERVLGIIQKGLKDRRTVNGEIMRLHSEMLKRYEAMKSQMKEIDAALEELNRGRSEQLRDSISTINSMDRSTAGSLDTPRSSPASSVVMTGRASSITPVTPDEPKLPPVPNEPQIRPSGKRYASTPASSCLPRKTPTSRSSASNSGLASRASRPSPGLRTTSSTPTQAQRPSLAASDSSKPRWNSSTNINNTSIGHNFKPLTLTTPSPYRKITAIVRTPRSATSNTSYPVSSPLRREGSISPASSSAPPLPHLRRISGRYGNPNLSDSKPSLSSPLQSLHSFSRPPPAPNSEGPRPHIRTQASTPQLPQSTRPRSTLIQQEHLNAVADDSPSTRPKLARAATAMGGRRISMIPLPKTRIVSGRTTPALVQQNEADDAKDKAP